MQVKLILSTCVLAALAVGCATSPADCDPSVVDQGFLDKLRCASSGSYNQRLANKEQQIHNAKVRQQTVSRENAALNKQVKLSKQQVKAKQSELAGLNKNIRSLAQKAKAKNQGNQAVLAQIQKIEANAGQAATAGNIEQKTKARRRDLEELQRLSQ